MKKLFCDKRVFLLFFLGLLWIIYNLRYNNIANANNDKCSHTDTEFRCVDYVKAYDLDSITFNIPNVHPIIGKQMPVRVYGLDGPERKSKSQCEKEFSQIASDFVRLELKRATVIHITELSRPKYFRLLGRVKYKKRTKWYDLTSELLKRGFAVEYYGKTKNITGDEWCAHYEIYKELKGIK